jgi:hypothetical protein
MLIRLFIGAVFLQLLLFQSIQIHLFPQITIYTNQAYAPLRIAAFGVCLLSMILSRPKWISGRVSLLFFILLFAELVMYFRPVPVDPSGVGEAVAWFLPFWMYVNLLNLLVIPAAAILLLYSYVYQEKTYYVIFAAIYLILLGTLFPFEQICRWGTYALM